MKHVIKSLLPETFYPEVFPMLELNEFQTRKQLIYPLVAAEGWDVVPTEAEIARQEGRGYESAEELLERIGRQRPGRASVQ
jgi:hypothetical protein